MEDPPASQTPSPSTTALTLSRGCMRPTAHHRLHPQEENGPQAPCTASLKEDAGLKARFSKPAPRGTRHLDPQEAAPARPLPAPARPLPAAQQTRETASHPRLSFSSFL